MPTVFMPRTLEELLALKQTRPGLFVFAGGTDLMIRMRNQLIQPDALTSWKLSGKSKKQKMKSPSAQVPPIPRSWPIQAFNTIFRY
jgi:CO/xanthine dehydrogenase FAD-binding subunit